MSLIRKLSQAEGLRLAANNILSERSYPSHVGTSDSWLEDNLVTERLHVRAESLGFGFGKGPEREGSWVHVSFQAKSLEVCLKQSRSDGSDASVTLLSSSRSDVLMPYNAQPLNVKHAIDASFKMICCNPKTQKQGLEAVEGELENRVSLLLQGVFIVLTPELLLEWTSVLPRLEAPIESTTSVSHTPQMDASTQDSVHLHHRWKVSVAMTQTCLILDLSRTGAEKALAVQLSDFSITSRDAPQGDMVAMVKGSRVELFLLDPPLICSQLDPNPPASIGLVTGEGCVSLQQRKWSIKLSSTISVSLGPVRLRSIVNSACTLIQLLRDVFPKRNGQRTSSSFSLSITLVVSRITLLFLAASSSDQMAQLLDTSPVQGTTLEMNDLRLETTAVKSSFQRLSLTVRYMNAVSGMWSTSACVSPLALLFNSRLVVAFAFSEA